MEKKSNYGKIIVAVIGAAVGIAALAFFVSKLLQKYFVLKDAEYDDLMEGDDEAGELIVDHADEEEDEEASEEEDESAEEVAVEVTAADEE